MTANLQAIRNLLEDTVENCRVLQIMIEKEEQKTAAPARRSAHVTLFTDSSFLKSVAYESKTRDLTVEMQNGSAYVYLGVPEYRYNDFIDAKSGGKFYNDFIKNQYAVRRI